MILTAGTRLGPYEIAAPLGAGGMGEVYRAHDTRLGRVVAIKVLGPRVAGDPDSRARFEREARTISQLNHPHVCALYDVGREVPEVGSTEAAATTSAQAVDYLVMEYLEGETLAERLGRCALSLDEALRHAIEIADALDTAHRRGIVHRDLKPSNVMLTKAGVKLLDFGLAKLFRPAPESGPGASASADRDESSALTASLTDRGVILGTPSYMAPEQVEGRDIDACADLFAFGVIVYEMVTGRRPFDGESVASVSGAILNVDPPRLGERQPATPPSLDRLVHRCLAKDPENRWQSARDVLLELRWLAERPGEPEGITGVAGRARHRGGPFVAGALLSALVVASIAWLLPSTTAPVAGPVRRATLNLPPGVTLETGRVGILAWSPDGSTIVFSGIDRDQTTRLYRLPLDHADAEPIPGTEGGTMPFYSPDGAWIGFFASGELRKVATTGGPAVAVCQTPVNVFRGFWGPDDTIVFAGGAFTGQLFRVAADGGEPQALLAGTQGAETGSIYPKLLPDAGHVLFTVWRSGVERSSVAAVPLRGGEPRVLVDGASAQLAPTGHLLFAREGSLWAVPFDAVTLDVRGTPIPVLDGLHVSRATAAAHYEVSSDGSLVYLSGEDAAYELLSVDLDGSEHRLASQIGSARGRGLALSPDGGRIAFQVDGDIWVHDIARDVRTRLTLNGSYDTSPAWTPDGREIVFSSRREGGGIFSTSATTTGPVVRLVEADRASLPRVSSVTPDGRHVLYHAAAASAGARFDVMMASIADGDATGRPLIEGPFDQVNAVVSPDGRWVAYQSDESGRFEVYVRPFPDADQGRVQVSASGGEMPAWSRDGRTLYFRRGDSMMAAPLVVDPSFSTGVPEVLFERRGWSRSAFDRTMTTDGRRFVLHVAVTDSSAVASPGQLRVVFNWLRDLEARVPVR